MSEHSENPRGIESGDILFRGEVFDPEKYTSGQTVVINHEGNWIQAELTSDATITGLKGEFKAIVSLPGGATKDISVDYLPERVDYPGAATTVTAAERKKRTIKENGENFLVSDTKISRKGDVEYVIEFYECKDT